MSLRLTLGDCMEAEAALSRLASQPAPPKTAYRLAKLLRLIRVETQHFQAQRETWIKELGAPREPTEAEKAQGVTGEVTAVTPENTAAFLAKLTELAAVPVEIDWLPLTLAEIESLTTVRAEDLIKLGPCVAE